MEDEGAVIVAEEINNIPSDDDNDVDTEEWEDDNDDEGVDHDVYIADETLSNEDDDDDDNHPDTNEIGVYY